MDTLKLLAEEISKISGVECIETDTSLTALGVDSINVIELIVYCEQLYGVFDPSELQLDAFTTLESLDEQLKMISKSEVC